MKDLSFNISRSWKSVADMIVELCDLSADISFNNRQMEGWRLPCLEVRLDNPDNLELPVTEEVDGALMEKWKNGTVVVADCKREFSADEPSFLIERDGQADVIYRAFKEMVRVLKSVDAPVEFAWSTIPLAPMCDDKIVLREREKVCFMYGSVHTLWMRGDDAAVQDAIRRVSECGRLQVQNMTTANTWIADGLQENKLEELF